MNIPLELNFIDYISSTDVIQLNQKIDRIRNTKKVILLGPLFTAESSLVNDLRASHDAIIQVDCLHLNDHPYTITLGDGDSVLNNQKTKFDYLFPEEKDFSDFEAALNFIQQYLRPVEIILHGFWGGRFDHALLIPCQITEHLLHSPHTHFAELSTSSNFEKLIILNKGKHQFNEQIPFSLISSTHQKIILEGNLKYKGTFNIQPWTGLGISNHSFGQWSIECVLPIWKYILSNV